MCCVSCVYILFVLFFRMCYLCVSSRRTVSPSRWIHGKLTASFVCACVVCVCVYFCVLFFVSISHPCCQTHLTLLHSPSSCQETQGTKHNLILILLLHSRLTMMKLCACWAGRSYYCTPITDRRVLFSNELSPLLMTTYHFYSVGVSLPLKNSVLYCIFIHLV